MLFSRAVFRLDDALSARDYPLAPVEVFEAGTMAFDPSDISTRTGMEITSPPYPNAYEYWLYHKYRMCWFGFDLLSVKAREIGARAYFFRRNQHTEDDFSQ